MSGERIAKAVGTIGRRRPPNRDKQGRIIDWQMVWTCEHKELFTPLGAANVLYCTKCGWMNRDYQDDGFEDEEPAA